MTHATWTLDAIEEYLKPTTEKFEMDDYERVIRETQRYGLRQRNR